jgi:hypothetical protein
LNPETAVQFFEVGPGESLTLRFADDRILTTLYVAKTNAAEPSQGVPGALYDLFVQGTPPLSTPASEPLAASSHAQLTWYAQGITDRSGHLGFTIPVGFSWCLQERTAPPEFVVDPALRCTSIINQGSPDPVRSVAVSETVATVSLSAFKFNSLRPNTVIPGATYALFVNGAFPSGFQPPETPPWLLLPPGASLWALSTIDSNGRLEFILPSGHSWCLKEIRVPQGYLLDDGLHCTGILTSSTQHTTSVALPELATTGIAVSDLLTGAMTLLALGTAVITRARRTKWRISDHSS